MVVTINSAPKIAHMDKTLDEARVAFITTAGVRLKTDPPFETKKGDPTFRIIPGDVDYGDLTVNHEHYDIRDALEDINLVFPLDILRQFAREGKIGEVAPHHFGLMGYIPQVKKLMNKTAPAIADQLQEDQVDIVLLSPG